MSNGTFDFNVFIQESKDALVNPRSYFSTMKTSGGMTEPMIKAVAYGAVAGAFAFLWSILRFGVSSPTILGGTMGFMLIIYYIIASLVGLFIGAVLLMVISSICKGSIDFESNVRVTSSVMVVIPIAVILSFTLHFNLYLGVLVSTGVDILALWLLYNALIQVLKSRPETTKTVMLILVAVIVLFSLLSLRA